MRFSLKLIADNDNGYEALEGQAALDWFAKNANPALRIVKPGNGYAKMTRETRQLLSRSAQSPRQNTGPGRAYDERRAYEYMRQITGHEHWRAEWEGDRIRYVRGADGERRQIPHWDWNGHNQTIEDCQINETRDEVELLFA